MSNKVIEICYTLIKKCSFNYALLFFVSVSIIFGTIFIFKNPPFWGVSESSQFARAYQISSGRFLSVKFTPKAKISNYGGYLPSNLAYSMDTEMKQIGNAYLHFTNKTPEYYQNKNLSNLLNSKIDSGKQVPNVFTNTAVYSPISYLPSILGILIGKMVSLSVKDTLYLARFSNLIVFLIVVGFVIYTLNDLSIRWLVVAVTLLPMFLFQETIVNADGFTLDLSILVIALIIKSLYAKKDRIKFTRIDMYLMFGSVVILPLLKPTYIFLSLLVLLVPSSIFKNKRVSNIYKTASIGLGVVGFLLWNYHVKNIASSIELIKPDNIPNEVFPTKQLLYVIEKPFTFMHTLYNSIVKNDSIFNPSIFGALGFSFVEIPYLAQIFSIVGLVLSSTLVDNLRLRKSLIIAFALAILLGFIGVDATLYITFTSYKDNIIQGVQGRYFLPWALPSLVLLGWLISNNKESGRLNINKSAVIICALIVASLVMSTLKYIHVVY